MLPGVLSQSDRDFLSALRGGVTAVGYARQHAYSPDWAKWKSRTIRAKLGVPTLKEAVRMSEITREDLDEIRSTQRELKAAMDRLANASSPQDRREARQDVSDARGDLDAELRRRGLTADDLDRLQGEKEYEKYKTMQARLDKEREDEQAAKAEADAKAEAERVAAEEAEKAEKKRDGLGGRRNR